LGISFLMPSAVQARGRKQTHSIYAGGRVILWPVSSLAFVSEVSSLQKLGPCETGLRSSGCAARTIKTNVGGIRFDVEV
jgi:hypothetical protein